MAVERDRQLRTEVHVEMAFRKGGQHRSSRGVWNGWKGVEA
ncbi:MAG: hypothetical protein ACT4PY_07760 [Armatimonadota bacterium]